ncbi:MAG TPA: hypothetical protein EYG91_01425 [Aquifex aeolicus]|nr:hypothetical protein [Aquifex aeolicus]
MIRIWEELDRIEHLFLELLDDPYKKEILLYLICYCQQVRKIGDYEIDLKRLLNCAEKPYKLIGGSWHDVLLELAILYVKDGEGKIYTGKELLTLTNTEKLKVGIVQDYREDFYKFYTKLLKYWSVLSSKLSYGNNITPDVSTRLLVLSFNEKLFKESKYYGEILMMRYPNEKEFFESIHLVADFFNTYSETGNIKEENLKKALSILKEIPKTYYSVNIGKFRKDIEKFMKDIKKGQFRYIRIEFVKESKGKKRNILSRIWKFLKSLGGNRWSSTSSEADYYSFIEILLKKPKNQIMMN